MAVRVLRTTPGGVRPALLAVSQGGRWAEWLAFFLGGAAEEAADAASRAQRLRDLRARLRERLQRAGASSHALRLADDLFARPAITVPQAAALLGITDRAARQNVRKLVDAMILREATGRRRGRVYVADEITRAVE